MGETLQTLMANLLNSFYPLVKPKHILDTLQNFPSAHLHGICELFLQDNLSYHHPVSRYYEILSNGSASHIKFLKWSFLFSWLIGSLIWPTHNQHNHNIRNRYFLTLHRSIQPIQTWIQNQTKGRGRIENVCLFSFRKWSNGSISWGSFQLDDLMYQNKKWELHGTDEQVFGL